VTGTTKKRIVGNFRRNEEWPVVLQRQVAKI